MFFRKGHNIININLKQKTCKISVIQLLLKFYVKVLMH